MKKVKMLRYIKSLLLMNLLLLSGCFHLPEYAQPHIMEIGKKQEGFKREITYRKLTVDDFQASKLPEDTSLYFDPKAQRWWLYRVEDLLLKQGEK